MRGFKGLKPERGKPRYRTSITQTTVAPDQVNVVFVYGAGNDERYGGGMRYLQDECVRTFGDKIYSPRIIDYRELETLKQALIAWSDPTILVGHSCGGEPITEAARDLSSEVIPFLMVIAPSIFCKPVPVHANVARITQATSDDNDIYNPGSKTLIEVDPSNNVTQLDVIYTNMPHLEAPYSDLVRDRLIEEIDRALRVEQPEPEPEPEPATVQVHIRHPATVAVEVTKEEA